MSVYFPSPLLMNIVTTGNVNTVESAIAEISPDMLFMNQVNFDDILTLNAPGEVTLSVDAIKTPFALAQNSNTLQTVLTTYNLQLSNKLQSLSLWEGAFEGGNYPTVTKTDVENMASAVLAANNNTTQQRQVLFNAIERGAAAATASGLDTTKINKMLFYGQGTQSVTISTQQDLYGISGLGAIWASILSNQIPSSVMAGPFKYAVVFQNVSFSP